MYRRIRSDGSSMWLPELFSPSVQSAWMQTEMVSVYPEHSSVKIAIHGKARFQNVKNHERWPKRNYYLQLCWLSLVSQLLVPYEILYLPPLENRLQKEKCLFLLTVLKVHSLSLGDSIGVVWHEQWWKFCRKLTTYWHMVSLKNNDHTLAHDESGEQSFA